MSSTIKDVFATLLDAGSVTLLLTESQANSVRTQLYRELKRVRKHELEIYEGDNTSIDRLTNCSIQCHVNEDTGYVTYEFKSKVVQMFNIITAG